MTQASLPIVVTIGDPHGIGPEIAVKAAVAFLQGGPRVILVGDRFIIDHYRQRLFPTIALREAGDAAPRPDCLEFLPVEALRPHQFKPGQIDAAAGAAMVAYAATAIDFARAGEAHAVVGCPHNETAVNRAGIPFTGYPGLVARLTHMPEERVFMMLVGGGLRILHVTLHERLADALARITPELVEAAVHASVKALARLGVTKPRIGLFGINPHAGEGGLFGNDDERINVPTAARLRAAGIDVVGPVGADVMLGERNCDAYIAMFHDQGHIPVKLMAGRHASALSIGSGVLFSSVGHGSAFDIAGQGIADPEAVIRTVRLLAGHG
jgi:4-hydroxythreonine-4-phosphate dehydrogenase